MLAQNCLADVGPAGAIFYGEKCLLASLRYGHLQHRFLADARRGEQMAGAPPARRAAGRDPGVGVRAARRALLRLRPLRRPPGALDLPARVRQRPRAVRPVPAALRYLAVQRRRVQALRHFGVRLLRDDRPHVRLAERGRLRDAPPLGLRAPPGVRGRAHDRRSAVRDSDGHRARERRDPRLAGRPGDGSPGGARRATGAAGARRRAPRLARLLREALGRLLPPRSRCPLPGRGVAVRPVARRRRRRARLARRARRDLRVLEAADGLLAALHLVPRRRHVSGGARRSSPRPPHLPLSAPARLGVRYDALRQRPLPRGAGARAEARRNVRAPARRQLPHGRARLGALRLLRLVRPPARVLPQLGRVRPLLLDAAHLPLSGAAVLPDDAPSREDGPRPRARARRLARGGRAPRPHQPQLASGRGGDRAEPRVPGDVDGGRPRGPRAAPANARHRGLARLFPLERLPQRFRPGGPSGADSPGLRQRARLRGVAPAAAVRLRAGDVSADRLRKLRALQRDSRRLSARPLPSGLHPAWKALKDYGPLAYHPLPESVRLSKLTQPIPPTQPKPADRFESGRGPEELFKTGMARFHEGKPTEAAPYFRTVLTDFPASAFAEDAEYFYTICLFREGRWQETIAGFEELVRRRPAGRWVPADRYEPIFVDDGSSDGTGAILRRLAGADPCAKLIRFSRNFGHQVAITAGIRRARGDAVVTIDADLQDPPSLIPRMVALWEAGNQVVFARREEREGETWFKRATAALFYRLLDRLAGINIPQNTGDFRLIDRKVADELNRMNEHNRFLRGLVSWVGFRQVAIEYVRRPRHAGETKYPIRKMIRFAWDGIISFSDAPLRAALNLGFGAIMVAFLVLLYGLYQHWTGNTVRGWTSLMVTVLFLGGVQLFTLGVIGEYLSRMHDEIKRRPLYVGEQEINVDSDAR